MHGGAKMKAKKFTTDQIITCLKEHQAGVPTQELCRKYSISNATIYNWKAKYGSMEVSDAKRLKELEEENRKLKRVVADLTLDNVALKDLNAKKW
jgi:putative transposase